MGTLFIYFGGWHCFEFAYFNIPLNVTCVFPLKGLKKKKNKKNRQKEQNKKISLQREGMEVTGERGDDMGSGLMGWKKLCSGGIQDLREDPATQYHSPRTEFDCSVLNLRQWPTWRLSFFLSLSSF